MTVRDLIDANTGQHFTADILEGGAGGGAALEVLEQLDTPVPTADTVIGTSPPAEQALSGTVLPFAGIAGSKLALVGRIIYGHLADITEFTIFARAIRPDGSSLMLGGGVLRIVPAALDVATEQGLTIVAGGTLDVSGMWMGVRLTANRITGAATTVLVRPQSLLLAVTSGPP